MLATSVFRITVLYITLPGLALIAAALALVAWLLRGVAPHRGNLRRGFAGRSAWYAGAAALALLAALLGAALAPVAIVYTFSPYILTESSATLVRLGAVSDTAVRVWVRAPGSASFAVSFRSTAEEGAAWVRGADAVALPPAWDHTGVAQLSGLAPGTEYAYRVELGGVAAEDVDGDLLRGSFWTLPPPGAASRVRFVFGSCSMKSMHLGYEMVGFKAVQDFKPSFQLFLGDLIYADVPMSIIGLGSDSDAYRAHYRRTFADVHLATMGRSVPTFYQYDDHEIVNDMRDPSNPTFRPAVQVWREYAGSGNPPYSAPPGAVGANNNNASAPAATTDGSAEGFEPTYYEFRAGGACFFVLARRLTNCRTCDY